MDTMDEKRVWQRVRGKDDRAEQLRACLARQGTLLNAYRAFSRRGGNGRQLFEQKQNQIACLRGALRVLTGQSVAPPRTMDAPIDLLRCHAGEQEFLRELTEWSRDPELGSVFEAMRERQKCQCRLLLEVIGTM